MPEAAFPARALRRFVEKLSAELGYETLTAVLEKSGLPADWARPEHLGPLDAAHAAQAYARLQAGVRIYYGRGARGILMRIGNQLWQPLLEDASVVLKARAGSIRLLPRGLRRKPALDLLARLLSVRAADVAAHTQDLDLLLVDHVSPTTLGQSESGPICFVTLGLIRAALYWAAGEEHDIEESGCRAMGAVECKFKIRIGG